MDKVESKMDQASVTADQARLRAQEAIAVAEQAEGKSEQAMSKVNDLEQQVAGIITDVGSLKGDNLKQEVEQIVKASLAGGTVAGSVGLGGDSGVAPVVRGKSGGARMRFVHERVIVQGFFDYRSGKGALERQARDDLAAKLLGYVDEDVKSGFKLEKRYNLSRRLVFVLPNGGEKCGNFGKSSWRPLKRMTSKLMG